MSNKFIWTQVYSEEFSQFYKQLSIDDGKISIWDDGLINIPYPTRKYFYDMYSNKFIMDGYFFKFKSLNNNEAQQLIENFLIKMKNLKAFL